MQAIFLGKTYDIRAVPCGGDWVRIEKCYIKNHWTFVALVNGQQHVAQTLRNKGFWVK